METAGRIISKLGWIVGGLGVAFALCSLSFPLVKSWGWWTFAPFAAVMLGEMMQVMPSKSERPSPDSKKE